MRTILLIHLLISLTVGTTLGQSRSNPYQEDLSRLRPPVEPAKALTEPKSRQRVEAIHSVNESVDRVLDSIAGFNRSLKYTDGFRIQVYSGQKKQEAIEAAAMVNEAASDLKAEVEFVQPKFRVVVGKYYSRIEAHRDLYRLRRMFPGVIIVPEKVNFTK